MHYQTTSTGCPIDDNQHSILLEKGAQLYWRMFSCSTNWLILTVSVFQNDCSCKGRWCPWSLILERDLSQWTRQSFSKEKEKDTRVCTFLNRRWREGLPDTVRDPRGFAVKFYTEEGNFDMTGNNTPIFLCVTQLNFQTLSIVKRSTPNTMQEIGCLLGFPQSCPRVNSSCIDIV